MTPTAAAAATATIRPTSHRFIQKSPATRRHPSSWLAPVRPQLASSAGYGRRTAQGADHPAVHRGDRLPHQLERRLDALLSGRVRRLAIAGAEALGTPAPAADPADPRSDAG